MTRYMMDQKLLFKCKLYKIYLSLVKIAYLSLDGDYVSTVLLAIVNGLVRRALLRTSCLGLYFEKKAARATSKKFRRVTSVNCFVETFKRIFS